MKPGQSVTLGNCVSQTLASGSVTSVEFKTESPNHSIKRPSLKMHVREQHVRVNGTDHYSRGDDDELGKSLIIEGLVWPSFTAATVVCL